MDNDENMDLMLSDEELEKLGISFHEPTPEEIEEKRIKRAKELESKGFLPENAELNETMSSPQELVETNPRRFIIEECIPACQELWSKNIYTFMVSDHLNEGQCWIEIIVDGLSDENKEVFMNLSGDDVIKFSYHRGTITFGVKLVGKEGQSRLLELAQQFQMQDVPINQSYISMQDFLLEYCGCYDEIPNPNYIEMKPAWEMELSVEQIADYMQKYDEWQESPASKKTFKQFNPNKLTKSVNEVAEEKGMIIDGDRVYLSKFHYKKHQNYLNSLENVTSLEEKTGHSKK